MGVTENEGSLEISQENKITSTGSKTSRIQDLLGRANPEEDRQHIIRQSCPENYIQMKKIRPGAGIKIYLSRSAAVNFAGGGVIRFNVLSTFWLHYWNQWQIKGAPQARVPKAQNFVNFMHLLENLVKLYVGGPMEGQHRLLRGILDQPLVLVIIDSEGYL